MGTEVFQPDGKRASKALSWNARVMDKELGKDLCGRGKGG